MSKEKIGGYCCVYDVIDTYKTMWDRGVFSAAEKMVADGGVMPVFFAHETLGKVPVGDCKMLRSDNTGLYYEAEIYDTDIGYHMTQAIDGRSASGTSFSFLSLEEYVRAHATEKIVHFKKAHMREISPVVWPGIRETTCVVLHSERLGIENGGAERLESFRAVVGHRQVRTRAALNLLDTLHKECIDE